MLNASSAYVSALLWILLTVVAIQGNAADQRIVIGGAQSLIPLAEKFSTEFRQRHPSAEIDFRSGGSNYAVQAVRSGEIDVGLVTRSLTPSERTAVREESIGQDAIIVLTYPGNSVRGISLEQLRRIYLGKIVNWRELGGEDKGIVPLTREKSSALHGIFTEILFGKGFNGQDKAFVLKAEKEKVLKTIKRVAGSVGYGIVRVEEAEAQWVRVLEIEGRFPNPENIRERSYPFLRPHLILTKNGARDVVKEWVAGFARFYRQAASGGNLS